MHSPDAKETNKYITKLLPREREYGDEILYYNKKYDFKKGYQIVLYFFDTNCTASMEYICAFIRKIKLYKTSVCNNFYAFVTEQPFGAHLNALQQVPEIFNYNIILDNWNLNYYMREKCIPQVVIYSAIGRFIGYMHPGHSSVNGAIATHGINNHDDFEYLYTYAISSKDNILHKVSTIESGNGYRYAQKLQYLHEICSNIQTPNLIRRNFVHQYTGLLNYIPYICYCTRSKSAGSVLDVSKLCFSRVYASQLNLASHADAAATARGLDPVRPQTATGGGPQGILLTREKRRDMEAQWRKHRAQQLHRSQYRSNARAREYPGMRSASVSTTTYRGSLGGGATDNAHVYDRNGIVFSYGFNRGLQDVMRVMNTSRVHINVGRRPEKTVSQSKFMGLGSNTIYQTNIREAEDAAYRATLEHMNRRIQALQASLSDYH